MSYFKAIRYAERYHGAKKSPPFVEGWYYKIVDAAGENRFAVIPAIYNSEQADSSYASIQVLDGLSNRSALHRYSINVFNAEKKRFAINIGANHFSETRLALNVKSAKFSINGTLVLGETTPWPKKIFSPGIMGPASYFPNSQFHHQIVSLNHSLIGHLNYNVQKIDFTGGKGYIQKSWGRTFPSDQLWVQSNNFSSYDTSLIGLLSAVPRQNKEDRLRFAVGLHHKGFLHRFASYNRGTVEKLDFAEDYIEWELKSGRKTLNLLISRGKEGILYGASEEGMTERVEESLQGEVQLTLKDGGTMILRDTGRSAGLHLHGEAEKLTKAKNK